MTIEAAAPTRIDLAGGTLDIWPVHLMLEDPVTVNLALATPAVVRATARRDRRVVLRSVDHGSEERFPSLPAARSGARHRLAVEALAALPPEGGVEIETRSAVPPGSGLGGSSSLSVALCAALGRLRGDRRGPTDLALFASNVEGRVLQVPPGSQDHLAAAHGGLAAWHYGPGGVRREVLAADPSGLARRLLLVDTRVAHSSAGNNWRVVRAFLDGDRKVRRGFAEVAAAANGVRAAVLEGDLGGLADGMERDSRARRRLFPGFHTDRTLSLAREARRAGALGGRPCGAGGGGCMVFLVEEARREAVEAAVGRLDARVLPVRPDRRGVRVGRLP